MTTNGNRGFSGSKKATLVAERDVKASRPNVSPVLHAPKKMRLERLSLQETTSAMMKALSRTLVEHLSTYFEQTCDRRPHETAVICGSSQLTYQQLDQRANRLAHFLISRGIEKGNTVGILLERSLDTYIALLGTLKAGAAFVPLDPLLPSSIVAFIAQDAGLRAIVTTFAFRDKTNTLPCPVLELDRVYESLSLQQDTRPQIHIESTSLCFINYGVDTSSQPKGVAISHANIVNFLRVVTPIYKVTRNDRVYQGMSTAIDSSFEEIWPTWIVGATLVAGPTNPQSLFGHGLTEFLIQHKITVLCCTPTLLATIERDVPSLRTLILGGEVCPMYLISRWSRPGRRMFNTYGPTETTVTATWCELFPGRPITIGFPLPTYYVYILDDQLRPLEEGQSGEIYIGGPGVALGYHNRPKLTKECFILNPAWSDRELVPHLYRTGDVGRITSAGEIEFLGRIDTHMNNQAYSSELRQNEQTFFPQATSIVLKGPASVSSLQVGAISKRATETVMQRMLKLPDIRGVYKNVITDPLYKNALFNMASIFVVGGLGFFFWILIARLYKAEYVGIATTLISIMTLVSSFTVLGLNSSLMRYLPRSVNKNELINSSFVVVTVVAILTSIVFLLELQTFSPQLLFLRSNPLYIISFTIFVIFYSWNNLVEGIFMAFRAASNILIKNIIISALKLLLPFALIAFAAYGIFASAASAFALGVLASLMILIFKFKVRPSISVNILLIKETSTYSFANYITSFMFNMPSLVLPVIILNVLSAKYAAYYYIASMIQSILQIIPSAAAQALLTEGAYNEAELKKHVKKALLTILVIFVPITVIVVLWGNTLLQIFGKSYANEAFQFLQLYSASTIFTALILLANAIMNVRHKTKSLVITNVIGSLLTLWLSYFFISAKLVGVGWGWTLGQALSALLSLSFVLYDYSRKDISRIT